MADLRAQLEDAVGRTYRIERELGGGGMSHVFLAEEVDLGRMVVLKVLPPEMAAGVNQERFRREIQLAARLQHSHIVPLLTAGSSGDLLWYVMPFIEGESLRAKLAREGELPVAEAARILREVTDALAYAHERGIVHRDIKPDNVMLSSGHALVTDFGVAKAVSESTGQSSLTSLGMALGTPAYMAPEQASGDPLVDHRADLYAVGILAYEMLAGRPPFSGGSPQSLLAAQVTQHPERLSTLRPAVPPMLESLVMRCLEKRAADRWQHAREMAPVLDAVPSPSGSQLAPAYAISSGTEAAIQRSRPLRVGLLFVLAAVGALALVHLLVQQLGLPNWVFHAAVGLVVVSTPMVLLTGLHERRRAVARASRETPTTPTGLQRHFTWRRAILSGVGAFAGLGLLAGGYTGMRAMGIGPIGTLVAKGALAERERIVMAEFENGTPDTTLGQTVTELLRIDLSQSPMLTVYDASQTAAVLARMQLASDVPVTFDIAREIATREGIKAVLAGDIRPLAGGYVLSARLVGMANGEILWAGRQDAADAAGISTAIERLSATLRERVGESLRSIRSSAPLDQLTTGSLEALRAYVQADRESNRGDERAAIALLERAIAIDSGFGMAYRRLGVHLSNLGRDPARRRQVFTRAYELRGRLSLRERYLAEAAYHQFVQNDTAATVAAYQALLEKFPDDRAALNNLATRYSVLGRRQDALATYRRSIALGGAPPTTFGNAIPLEYEIGHPDTTRALIALFEKEYPDHPQADLLLARYLAATGQHDSARAMLDDVRSRTRGNQRYEQLAIGGLENLARVQGQLVDRRRHLIDLISLMAQADTTMYRGFPRNVWLEGVNLGQEIEDVLAFVGDQARARSLLDRMVTIMESHRPPVDVRVGWYEYMVGAYAQAGDPARAREFLARWEREAPDSVRRVPLPMPFSLSSLDLAEGRAPDAIARYRRFRELNPACTGCALFEMGRAFDQAGQPDSAIAWFERALGQRMLSAGPADQAVMLRRLGQLYENRGDRARAIEYYTQFVDLWRDADPELQPLVAETRRWIAQLARET